MTSTWQKRVGLALPLLVIYWITLGVATHWPGKNVAPTPPWDKFVHAGSFAVLAFMAAFVWRGNRRTSLMAYLGLWAVLATYAALDELTQPYFGRTCDIADWLADAAGMVLGLLAHFAWTLRNRPAE